MHTPILTPRPAGVIWASATTATASTDAFSRSEIFRTLRSLAGAYADFEAVYHELCWLPAVDVAALFHARRSADTARRALDLHARRLLPHVAPTISTDACGKVAMWLAREAQEEVMLPGHA